MRQWPDRCCPITEDNVMYVCAVTMGKWKFGFCGCFGNCTVCVITACIPCYTEGKIAEKTGKGCILYGLLYMIQPAIIGCINRTDVRKSKGIESTPFRDYCAHCWCSLCALCQEARETGALGGDNMADGGQVMERLWDDGRRRRRPPSSSQST